MVRYLKYKKEYNRPEFSLNSKDARVEKTNHINKVCLKCRQPGHKMEKCGQKSTRCCYRCGSTSHSLSSCSQEASFDSISNQELLPFAECFICLGKGHLSGNCLQNPKGFYPNGGGCKICGSVRHLAKNCLEKKLPDRTFDNEEYFSEEEEKKDGDKKINEKKVVKVVTFK